MNIALKDHTGPFAENKNIARTIQQEITPVLQDGDSVVLDFEGITGATQSFIHALISEPIRSIGPHVLEQIEFRNCSRTVQNMIELVVGYLQQTF